MKRKANKSVILRLLVLGVCAYFVINLVNLYSELRAANTELKANLEIKSQKENDIEKLKSLLDSDSDTELIEKAARERLGYIYPDEHIFIDISGS